MNPRVQQYVSGTGNRGGPLVTTANKTVQSDLRLYESDNNVTIERYSPNLTRSHRVPNRAQSV